MEEKISVGIGTPRENQLVQSNISVWEVLGPAGMTLSYRRGYSRPLVHQRTQLYLSQL